jgi:predicted GIY-YIG superfamily endonuclease
MNKKAPAYVYTLNLEGGRKYVGMTTNINQRMDQHFSGEGSAWTQKYAPVSIKSIKPAKDVDAAKKLETKMYFKMRDRHGTDMVRGAGHTTSIEYDDDDTDDDSSDDAQYIACQLCEKTFYSNVECRNHSCRDNRPKASVTCYRCGYHGHYATSCYASYHIRGYRL